MLKYQAALDFLNCFVNYEKKRRLLRLANLKLARLRHLLKLLRIEPNFKIVQVAGTKGKGSTSAFLASILASAGFKVGLFTSPHLEDFRERIKIIKPMSKKPLLIEKSAFLDFFQRGRKKIERFSQTPAGKNLSFFELLTALSLYYFQRQKVDFAVLEAGLGGRLDATNFSFSNALSVITPISYDHEAILGRSIKSIAREKAGIIKRKGSVVSAKLCSRASAAVKEAACKKKAELYQEGKDFSFKVKSLTKKQSRFVFLSSSMQAEFSLKVLGSFQAQNASLAVAAALLLGEKYSFALRMPQIQKGLWQADIKGRFEIFGRQPEIVLDIAHNAMALAAFFSDLKHYYPKKKIIFVFNISRDKNIKRVKKALRFDEIIIAGGKNMRLFAPEVLAARLRLKNKAYLAHDLKTALAKAYVWAKKGGVIAVSGSTYLVAEARKLLWPKKTFLN